MPRQYLGLIDLIHIDFLAVASQRDTLSQGSQWRQEEFSETDLGKIEGDASGYGR